MSGPSAVEYCLFVEPQQGGTYAQIRDAASLAEGLGFDGFFRSDHIAPIWPRTATGTTDAWTTLAGLARDTSTIALGTLVSPVTFRHPAMLAIQVANVQEMSGGRVELGLGAGWYEAEHRTYGLPFPRARFDLLEEQLAVIDALFSTDSEATLGSATWPLNSAPGPLTTGTRRPPIIIGGSGAVRTPSLAARFADEYNAFAGPSRVADLFERVRDSVARSGRDAATMRFSAAMHVVLGSNHDIVERRARRAGLPAGGSPDDSWALGSAEEVAEAVRSYEGFGVARVYLQLADVTDLDHVREVGEELLPLLR